MLLPSNIHSTKCFDLIDMGAAGSSPANSSKTVTSVPPGTPPAAAVVRPPAPVATNGSPLVSGSPTLGGGGRRNKNRSKKNKNKTKKNRKHRK